MTAELKIQIEEIKRTGDDFQILVLAGIGSFSLIVNECLQSSEIYQAKILDENSAVVLISPELELERCFEKIHVMIDSLGKIINIKTLNNDLKLKHFLQQENFAG